MEDGGGEERSGSSKEESSGSEEDTVEFPDTSISISYLDVEDEYINRIGSIS